MNYPSSHAKRKTHGDGGIMSIWTILFIVLLIAWIGGFTVMHVASGLIHILLVLAVISLVMHFVLGKSAT
jgi:hypothetical protein